MANINWFVDQHQVDFVPDYGDNRSVTHEFDFAAYTTANGGDGAANGVAAADVVRLFPVESGMAVPGVDWRVKTEEGATCTGDFGDTDDPNGFDDGVDLNSAGSGGTIRGTDAYGTAPPLYEADGYINFVPDNSVSVAVLNVTLNYRREPV